jgi:hypothetical protein
MSDYMYLLHYDNISWSKAASERSHLYYVDVFQF